MSVRVLGFAVCGLVAATPVLAQDGSGAAARVTAARVEADPPSIDGRLDDAAWSRAIPLTGFLQREPAEGQPASDPTEVRFVYTRDALYVGARMRSSDAAAIRAIVTRRDNEVSESEQLVISLDTRNDRRTAYSFAVTPGGVRLEYFHPGDDQGSRDYSYDPVWEAATSVDAEGWTAELRIPFTQLRFNPGPVLEWGVNVVRQVPSRNETAYWVLVRRNENGWASRMGRLEGIADIPAARRIELSPYVASEATRNANPEAGNPFSERYESTVRAGGDVKIGLGPNLTLDATINPDFGQVEADPAEVNLSAFETFFSERRPFFIEGSDLLGGRGTFYSRRIGSPPPGTATADYAESADNSTILGAAKITGRLPSGLAVGALAALTGEEAVATFDTATQRRGREVVAPRTLFGIVSVRQELGRDRSTIGATTTFVQRDLEGAVLPLLLARRAVTGIVDGRLRWAGGRYDISAWLGFSHLTGDSMAILGQQRNSRRYFQRPDADYVEVEPGRTSLGGTTMGINHSKMAGNWLWDVDYSRESPGLELNDIGQLGGADDQDLSGNVRYRQTRPGRVFHRWNLGFYGASGWNTGGIRQYASGGFFTGVTLKNFWEINAEAYRALASQSDNLTRGGPLMRTPAGWSWFVNLGGRPGSRLRWEGSLEGRADELGGASAGVDLEVSIRPTPQLELSLEPSVSRTITARQYVATRAGGPAATFGSRYIFAEIERHDAAMQLRASYAIKADLTLEAYVEPFASSGRYTGFGELTAARANDLRLYGSGGTTLTRLNPDTYEVTDGAATFSFGVPDFDVRSLRSNVVLRWEWQRGSTLFLVWQQDRSRRTRPLRDVRPSDLSDPFGIRGDHFVAVKVSYWIPVG